jgi:hypothetical protein
VSDREATHDDVVAADGQAWAIGAPVREARVDDHGARRLQREAVEAARDVRRFFVDASLHRDRSAGAGGIDAGLNRRELPVLLDDDVGGGRESCTEDEQRQGELHDDGAGVHGGAPGGAYG